MRMKFLRILPEIWASTSWPFGKATRNIVPGSTCVTLPVNSIGSSFATQIYPARYMLPAVHFGQYCARLTASALSPSDSENSTLPPPAAKIKKLFKAKILLDKRDETVRVPPINMKNSPLTTILLGVLTVSALASVVLCWLNISNTRELRSLQTQATLINNNRAFINALVSETMEYSKTHHGY